MALNGLKSRYVPGALLTVLLAALVQAAPPPRPASFFGTVTAGGSNAPVGTRVSAWIGGVEYAAAAVFAADGASVYRLDVPGDLAGTAAVEGGTPGQTVVFKVGGAQVQTAVWQEGSVSRLDLAAPFGPDLSVSVDDGVTLAAPGATLTYTVTVTNHGPGAATGVVVRDTLSSGTAFVSATGGGMESGGVVSWPAFDLAQGQTAARTVTAQVKNPLPSGLADLTNVARAADDGVQGLDPHPDDNVDADVDTLDAAPDLAVTVSDGVSDVLPGQRLEYRITVANHGTRDATGVVLRNTLPADVTFFAASDSGAEAGRTVTWPAFGLAPGAAVTRTFTARVNTPLTPAVVSLADTAVATPGNGDRNPADNTATDTDAVVRKADLTVPSVDAAGAATDPQSLAISGSVTIGLANAGNLDVTDAFHLVVFEDRDGDSRYTAGADNVLGQQDVAAAVPAGGQTSVSVSVTGSVLFRGNRISAFADSGLAIAEHDETNNVGHSGQGCGNVPAPGDFEPVLELNWPRPGIAEPFVVDSASSPVVIDLDGNGVPDIVFTTANLDQDLGSFDQTVLRAIRGDTGAPIFDVQSFFDGFNFFEFDLATVAAGDIDLDGRPEIITANLVLPLRGEPFNVITAYEHDGTRKWRSPAYSTQPQGRFTNRDNPAIADIDRDGVPEIIVGAHVFNNDGTLRWKGTGGQAYQSIFNGINPAGGAISLVADLDMTGNPEIVTGNTAYHSDGSIDWQVDLPDGYPAVANFDDDPFPEIVVVSQGTVRLHEHDGTLKWGPVTLPGRTPVAGGPPTVADFDADGEPEIGVAGSDFYTVFETDGTVKWQRPTQDFSSGMTGSTVFDFDGDGRFEVVYRDEVYLRIYRGEDGTVLAQFPVPSTTLNEQPTVADVDLDGNAEILVTADHGDSDSGIPGNASNAGLRVFGDANDKWVGTRSIWNQHAYSVGNVNDDGTIPRDPDWSWLSHNTYRAQIAPPGTAPFSSPDLTASRAVVDLSAYPTVTVTARIGNGGGAPVKSGLPVAFYDEAGGPLLGVKNVSKTLRPGEYEDVSFTWTETDFADRTVVIAADDDGTGHGRDAECDEANNRYAYTYDIAVLGLTLSLSDGQTAVGAGETYSYELRVFNAAGHPATGVALTDQIPAHTSVVAASDGGAASGGTVAWPAFNLGSGATAVRTLTLQVDDAIPAGVTEVTNRAAVTDDGTHGADPTPENNQAVDTNRLSTVRARAGGPYTADEGSSVALDASGSTDRDGTIVKYEWDLDHDGAFDDATGAVVSLTVDDEGSLTVAVQVTDNSGEVDTDTAQVTVVNRPPAFALGADLRIVEGGTVSLREIAFSDPGRRDTHTATVDWGDGTREPASLAEASGAGTVNAVHRYSDDGVFTVELCVADNDGGRLCDQLVVTVENSPPDVLGDGAPVQIDEGSVADVGLPFKDLGPKDEHTATFDWRDGTVVPGEVRHDLGSGLRVFADAFDPENGGHGQLNFASFARWTVSDGSVDLIGNGLFDFLPGNGLYVDLDGSTGNAGRLATRTPVAVAPGSYRLLFRLSGSRRGGTDTVTVRLGDLIEQDITLASREPFTQFSLPFVVTSSTALDLSFENHGGDNMGLLLDDISIADECFLAQSGDPSAGGTCGFARGVHLYPDDGAFPVEICVTDDDGGRDCGTVPVTVKNVAPKVDAGADRVVFPGDTLSLQAGFTDPGTLDPHTATITWGDGLAEAGTIVGGTVTGSHLYTTAGDYDARVCVTDDDETGCDPFKVFVRPRELDLAVAKKADPTVVRPGELVQFTIDVINQGSLPPHNITVVDQLPPDFEFVSASGGGVAAGGTGGVGGTVTWHIPELAFGQTATLTLTMRAAAQVPFGAEVVNTVAVSDDGTAGADVDPSDNSASAKVTLWDADTPIVYPGEGPQRLTGVEGDEVPLSFSFAVASRSTGAVLLQDDFNNENGGTGILNYFNLKNWTLARGAVDLIGRGFFDFQPAYGLYLDLDGSVNLAARLVSRTPFDLRRGKYRLEFDLAGSFRGDTNTVTVSLGSLFQESFTLGFNEPFRRIVRTIDVPAPVQASLVFDHQGADNVGLLLDNVLLQAPSCSQTVTVDWGDGSAVERLDASALSCGVPGTLAGRHVYRDDGVYPVRICVTDNLGVQYCAAREALIANVPPQVTTTDRTVPAHEPFDAPLGSFTDRGVLDTHTATVEWGDGAASAGTVAESGGSGAVTAGHTYERPGTYTAKLCVADDDGGEGCGTLQIVATGTAQAPDLVASKVDELVLDATGDGIAGPGDYLRYSITMKNAGGRKATGVVLRDLLPAAVKLLPGSIDPGDGTIVGENPVEVALGDIEAGGEAIVSFYVEILPTGAEQVSNQAIVLSAELPAVLSDDPDVSGPADPTVTVLAARPRLLAEKTDAVVLDSAPDGGSPGDVIEYTVTLRNTGNVALTGVELTDEIPAETTLVAGSVTASAGAVVSEDPVAVSVGTLAPGDEATVRFRVAVDDPIATGVREIRNQARVTSAELPSVLTDDPEVGGAEDPTVTAIQAAPVLRVEKTDHLLADADGNGLASPGDAVLYRITVTNDGNTGAAGVVLTDPLPAHATLVAGTVQTSQGAVSSENPVRVSLGEVAADSTATVSFQVRIDDPFPHTATELDNQAMVTASGLAEIASDDPDTPEAADPTRTPVFITPAAAIGDVAVQEGGGQAVLTVTLAPAGNREARVSWATGTGTALAGADYTPSSGVLTFAPGETSKTLTVPVLDDRLDELDETFPVRLADPVQAKLADAEGLVTIRDDDAPPQISIADASVSEGDEGTVKAVFAVTLSEPSGLEVTVAYATSDGTARAGSDYQPATGTLVIPAGSTSASVEVNVAGDRVDENDEAFLVTLSSPAFAVLARAAATGNVLDDDEARVSIGDAAVAEGNTGTVQLRLPVTLSTPSDREIRADWSVTPGTATAGVDYDAASGTVVFAPGETSRFVEVAVHGDLFLEPDETLFVDLSAPAGTAVGDGHAVGTIRDDESCPGPELLANGGGEVWAPKGTIAGWTVTEGAWQRRSSSPAPAAGTSYLSAGAASPSELRQDVKVSAYGAGQVFRFSGFVRTAAESPSDVAQVVVEYRDAANAVVLDAFDSGEIASPSQWRAVLDERPAPAGTGWIRVRLRAVRFSGAGNDAYFDGLSLVSLKTATLTVGDVSVYEGRTGTTQAVFPVRLSCAIGTDAAMTYATADGTARAGQDYLSASGSLTLPAGTTQASIPVTVLGDDVHEIHETFQVVLGNSMPAWLVRLDPVGVGTILDDDFCARSPGFWKNHQEVWPVTALVLGGVEYNAAGMMALLSYNGSDASTHLARQLVATELNLLVGSDPSILPVVQQAHALLASHPPGSNPVGAAKDAVEAVKDKLDRYNNSGCQEVPVIP